jgi:hypothetical protein
MNKHIVSWLAFSLAAISLLFYFISLFFSAAIPVDILGQHSVIWPFAPTDLGILVYPLVGALIAIRRSNNPIGWIFLMIGFFWEGWGLTNAYICYAEILRPGSLPLSSFAFWLPLELWVLAYFSPPLLLLLFPTGHLISRHWRPVVWMLAASILLELIASGSAVEAGSYHLETSSLLDYMGIGSIRDSIQTIGALLTLIIYGLGVVAIILRLRRARSDERQQFKWFGYAGVIFVSINIIEQMMFDNVLHALDPSALVAADLFLGIPVAIAFAVIPIAAAIAILRYRLYDIDIIIQRTIVYAILTAILGLVYFSVIVLMQLIFRGITGQSSDLAIVASTLVIAALFTPLRRRVQSAIDHRFFRRKYDAEKVLAAFNTTARHQVDINKLTDTFLHTVEDTLQPELVSLWLRPSSERGRQTEQQNQRRLV